MLIVLFALGVAFAAKHPQLETVKSVYLLAMGSSFDQYLATQLTETGVFQVVTDPLKADAIFTDKIGAGFEQAMQELYPPEEKKAVEEDEDQEKEAGDTGPRFGSFSKGRGTIYLVDRQSRNVIWSMYSPIRSSRADDVNRRAVSVITKLRKDLKPSK